MRGRLVLVLSLIVCIGAPTAGARAARSAGAGGVTTLASQTLLSSYQLTADADGAATVLWTTEKFVGPENLTAAVIRVRQQDAQGSWSAPVQIGGVTQTNEAQLVESASGAAAVVWYYVHGGAHGRTVLMVATRSSADGPWSAPKTIWSAPNADGLMMAVGIDAAGAATVAWAGYHGTNPAILGGFGLIAGADNELVAVWSTDTAKELALITATSADATNWSGPAQLARIHGGTYGPILAAAANGRIALAPLTGEAEEQKAPTRSYPAHSLSVGFAGIKNRPEGSCALGSAITPMRMRLREKHGWPGFALSKRSSVAITT